MTATTPGVIPSIRTLPLPTAEAKDLFSRAVRLAQRVEVEQTVKPWLEKYYSVKAVSKRLLPEKQRLWTENQRGLTAAPTKGELEHYATGSQTGWHPQRGGNFREHLSQHREAAKHPGYTNAIAMRRARLKDLKAKRKNWRPMLQDRLRMAVDDIIKAEYPDPPEHVEHSRRLVAIAALLMPEALPMLGELGTHPFAGRPYLKPTGDRFSDLFRMDPAEEAKQPHKHPVTGVTPRYPGREEVMFLRAPGESRKLDTGFPLDDLLEKLRAAVDELETNIDAKLPAGANEGNQPPKLKGRPRRTDPENDTKLYLDWKASGFKTMLDFANKRNLPIGNVKAAIHRAEVRLSASRQAK
jgi:hypothetical protein